MAQSTLLPASREAAGLLVLAFQAEGAVSTRHVFDKLVLRARTDMATLWEDVRADLEPLGFRGVDSVQLLLPLGQGSRNARVLVVVQLRGLASYREGLHSIAQRIPPVLERALQQLANSVTHAGRYDRVRPSGWKFANEEDFE